MKLFIRFSLTFRLSQVTFLGRRVCEPSERTAGGTRGTLISKPYRDHQNIINNNQRRFPIIHYGDQIITQNTPPHIWIDPKSYYNPSISNTSSKLISNEKKIIMILYKNHHLQPEYIQACCRPIWTLGAPPWIWEPAEPLLHRPDICYISIAKRFGFNLFLGVFRFIIFSITSIVIFDR